MANPFERTLRVMIVDDTVIYRRLLMGIVASLPGTEVVAVSSSGQLALNKLAVSPVDLILMDIHMPEMNGVETLRRIRKDHPEVSVVLVSSTTHAGTDITVEGLNAGALDFIAKPVADDLQAGTALLKADIERVLRLVRIRALRAKVGGNATRSPVSPPAAPVRPPVDSGDPADIRRALKAPMGGFGLVAIGVSTGGPQALLQVIPKLPKDFPVPILVVQHMPPVFTASLAANLAKNSSLPVHEAREAQAVLPGVVLIAPGGRHLTVQPDSQCHGGLVTAISDAPPVHSCRPSVDVLFKSIAEAGLTCGVLSVILTGMGEDGASGVEALKESGRAYCLAQDEQTCVVYGMPQAVVRRKLADEVLPLGDIAQRIVALTLGNAKPNPPQEA